MHRSQSYPSLNSTPDHQILPVPPPHYPLPPSTVQLPYRYLATQSTLCRFPHSSTAKHYRTAPVPVPVPASSTVPPHYQYLPPTSTDATSTSFKFTKILQVHSKYCELNDASPRLVRFVNQPLHTDRLKSPITGLSSDTLHHL